MLTLVSILAGLVAQIEESLEGIHLVGFLAGTSNRPMPSGYGSTGFLARVAPYFNPDKNIGHTKKMETLMNQTEPNKGHVHAEHMALFAEDAKVHAEPWKLWQIKTGSLDWIDCKFSPMWDPTCEFRRKPKVHIINGVEIPDLRITPKLGERYWCPVPESKGKVISFESWDNNHDVHRIENNLCYENTNEGMQAAILHSEAWLGIAKQLNKEGAE